MTIERVKEKVLTEVDAITDGDYLRMVSSTGGARKISFSNLLKAMAAENAGAHNSIYRGKNLGNAVTSEQYSAISSGKFTDLFIGDYWTINGVNWRIADFDYWLNYGDEAYATHHIVIVPDTNLTSAKMNNGNDTTGAYAGSDFYTGNNSNTGKATAESAVNSAFGSSHILRHREYIKNATTGGYESAGAWMDSTVDLMTEEMVYGVREFKNQAAGGNLPAHYTTSHGQLALFRHEHSRICNRSDWWLRDVASSAAFACVNHYGGCTYDGASAALGVCPAFAIKA